MLTAVVLHTQDSI